MMGEYDKSIKELVKARLDAMPPDVTFSLGGVGDYTARDLINEVDNGTEVGKAAIEMQVNFIRMMPKLLTESL
ncbi:MAG: hypothetical protein V1744_08140 [Candidatus Altiarchaeota archaeon]